VEEQRVDDFAVTEFEHLLAAIDNRHTDPERRKHDGVFEPDHAPANDDHRARDRFELQDLVGIEDMPAIEGNVRRTRGLGAARHEDMPGLQVHCLVVALDDDLVRTGEAGLAAVQVDAIAIELVVNHFDFVLGDVRHLAVEFLHRDLALVAIALAKDVALAEARQVQYGLAHRFGGNRPRMDADPARPELAALDHRHALVELRRGDSPFLPGRAAANDHQIVTHDGSPCGKRQEAASANKANPSAVPLPLHQIDRDAGRAIHKESRGQAFWRRAR
jgi:hypothetical protein